MIILASASPRRKKYLKQMLISFKSVAPNISEKTGLKRPHAIVKELALKKAVKIAQKYPDKFVIGADTIVVCKGRIIGKPICYSDAIKILKMENANWQKVYTGVAIVVKSKNKIVTGYEKTLCKARKLTSSRLKELASKHLDKAGAYAVQDKDDPFIEKIIGSYDNVVGFPVALFKKLLKKAGYKFI
jgi:septum formation protein